MSKTLEASWYGGMIVHFAKANRILIYTIYIYVLYVWYSFIDMFYSDVVSGKSSIAVLIDLSLRGLIAFPLAYLTIGGNYYAVNNEYLVEKIGLFRNRVKLSEIETIRWIRGENRLGGGATTSNDCLLIVDKENGKLKVSPKDVAGFLKLLRERCPNADITIDELPPKKSGDTIRNIIIFLFIAFVFYLFLK